MADENGSIYGFNNSTEADASFFLAAAESAVRRYCGWHVAPVFTLDGSLDHMGGRLVQLPAMHIGAVSSLCAYGVDLMAEGLRVNRSTGLVELPFDVEPGIAAISYELTAGFEPDEVPDLVSVALQAARRAESSPAGTVRSQSVNGASVSYSFSEGGAPSVQLLESEKSILDRYRIARLP